MLLTLNQDDDWLDSNLRCLFPLEAQRENRMSEWCIQLQRTSILVFGTTCIILKVACKTYIGHVWKPYPNSQKLTFCNIYISYWSSQPGCSFYKSISITLLNKNLLFRIRVVAGCVLVSALVADGWDFSVTVHSKFSIKSVCTLAIDLLKLQEFDWRCVHVCSKTCNKPHGHEWH